MSTGKGKRGQHRHSQSIDLSSVLGQSREVERSIEQKIIAKELSLRVQRSLQDQLLNLDSEIATQLSYSRTIETRERLATREEGKRHRRTATDVGLTEKEEGDEARVLCKELWELVSLHALECPALRGQLAPLHRRYRHLLI